MENNPYIENSFGLVLAEIKNAIDAFSILGNEVISNAVKEDIRIAFNFTDGLVVNYSNLSETVNYGDSKEEVLENLKFYCLFLSMASDSRSEQTQEVRFAASQCKTAFNLAFEFLLEKGEITEEEAQTGKSLFVELP